MSERVFIRMSGDADPLPCSIWEGAEDVVDLIQDWESYEPASHVANGDVRLARVSKDEAAAEIKALLTEHRRQLLQAAGPAGADLLDLIDAGAAAPELDEPLD